MNIAELFARIGLKTDEAKAKSFHRTMSTVKIGLFAATAAATVTSLAIKKIATEAMGAAVALKQFEVETGASAQELQKWQAVAEQTNQSAESVSSAIKAIVSNQEKIKLGQGDISGFQILGIDPRQDPFKILEELRTKTKGLSDGTKKNILSQMGVGAGMLQTLSLTNEQFDEMAGRAWIISPQAIETLNKTKSSVDLASRALGYMKAQIAVGLSPQIIKMNKDLQEFMKVNEKAIIEGFKQGFKYVTIFVKALYNAGKMIDRVVSSTIGWEFAIKGLIGVFIALNSALLLSPIGLIAAGFILLVAVLDDLYTYSKGGKSLFGEMMKEFPGLEKGIFGFLGTIRDVFKLLKAFAGGDGLSIDNIVKDWGALGKAIKFVYEQMRLFRETDVFKSAEKTKGSGLSKTGGVEAVKGKSLLAASLESLSKTFSSIMGDSRATNKTGPIQKENVALGSMKLIIDKMPASGPVTQTNKIDISVTGAGDPVATGDAVSKSLQRSINSASAQLPRNE